MGKYLKLFVLTMIILCMVAGSAFAGTTRVNHQAANTPLKVGQETLGTNRTIALQASAALTKANYNDAAPISFSMTQALSSGNLIVVTFGGGAAFDGQAINVCAMNTTPTGIIIATATPAAGTTNQAFNIVDVAQAALGAPNVAAGNHIWLSNSAACAVAGNAYLPVQILSTATSPTVKIAQTTSALVPLDDSTAVAVATILREFNLTNTSTSHTIDYLATGATGNKVLNGSNTTSSLTADSQVATAGVNIVAFYRANAVDYAANVAGNYGAALNIRGTVKLTDPDQSWAGVNRVYISNSPAVCSEAANVIVASNSPTGTVTLSIPAGSFPTTTGIAPDGINVCVQCNSSTLSTRTIYAQGIISVEGTGAGTGVTGNISAAQVWGINGYQAVIPWVVTDDGYATYCVINNGNASGDAANVLFEAIASEGSISIASTSLGTVAAKTSKLLTLDGTNATLAGGTPVSLSALGATKRYKVKATITAPPANVSVACVQKDPGGTVKRSVPVLTSETTGPFKQ